MDFKQEPKFDVADGKIVSRQSGPVPDDEPLFILRARDILAVPLLRNYLMLASHNTCLPEHLAAVRIRIRQFEEFAKAHPDRMKVPDTTVDCQWQELIQ